MNMQGLDYNTDREALLLPEYGREIKRMVDFAVGCPTKQERNACANTIIRMMSTKVPQAMESDDGIQSLWDHLYMMSGGQLDIDWPCDVSMAEKIMQKPAPMPIRKNHVRLRHYGHLIEELFDKLKTMPEGEAKNMLVELTASQMKRDLAIWGRGSMDDEKVADDLARFTDGKVQLDLDSVRLPQIAENIAGQANGNRNAGQQKKRKRK